jgi:sugar transferase EpsL
MIKRLFDICVSVAAIVLLSPLLLITMLVTRIKLGGPIFFRQQRPGLHGQSFEMVKFRTMADTRNSDGNLLSDGERLTAYGRFLRSTSIDELPELWNVLKGDMSLVGPRPLLMEYLPLYSAEQRRRHEVRPGVTGWAQINGRNAISWDEKFAFDIWYVDNRSFFLDLKIVFLTAKNVLFRRGVNATGSSTMPKFTGSADAVAAVIRSRDGIP